MLIIGHRGARRLRPENTLDALRAGFELSIDMIEFDIRLTRDKVPILLHDRHLLRTHKLLQLIHRSTFDDIKNRLSTTTSPIASLDEVLSEFNGQIMLNIELKDRGSAKHVIPIIEKHIKDEKDWESLLFSSFKLSELRTIRKLAPKAQLALLERFNPLRFLTVDKELSLDAVGFHRLHVNEFTVALAKQIGLFVYVHTVNRPQAAERLESIGVDAIVTDTPDTMLEYFSVRSAAK